LEGPPTYTYYSTIDGEIGLPSFGAVRLIALVMAGLALVACNSGDDERRSGPSPYLKGDFEAYIEKQDAPIVVNKWASWCGPCRHEFPFFESQARKRKGDVAFVGVNSQDNRADARDFLADNPVPYKHFEDPNQEIAAKFDGVQGFPVTAFYGADGEREYVHIGGYATEADLAEDIERYAR
jgi:thiol-disulfide isomerase/thioredoxin